jgi:hypothetical protein
MNMMVQMDFPYFDKTVASYCRDVKGHYILGIVTEDTAARFYLTEQQLLDIVDQIKKSLPVEEDQIMNMFDLSLSQREAV